VEHPQLHPVLSKKFRRVGPQCLWRNIAMFKPRAWFALKQVFDNGGYPFTITDKMDVVFGTIVEQVRSESLPATPVAFWRERLAVSGVTAQVAEVALAMLQLRSSTSQVEGLISRCAFLNDKRRSKMSDVRAARLVFCLGNRDELLSDQIPDNSTANAETSTNKSPLKEGVSSSSGVSQA